MRKIIFIVVLIVAAAAVLLFYNPRSVDNGATMPVPEGGAVAHIVRIKNFAFAPQTTTVGVGETVVWKNEESGVPHSIVADDGSFSSKTIPAGGSFERQFANAGTYAYHCGIHPSMKGTVVAK
ncbi:MAG: cupredoxin domain-containing protein [Candidatus Harrisonbacteria bacterium]|nr:cupredoxin domain-containing protein [Candidatus Harrisonbacteria bacterium]